VQLTYLGQEYLLIADEPYVRKDGRKTKLWIWRTECPECSESFYVKTRANVTRTPKSMRRRCDLHRAPGKRVKETLQ
jgi:hypothetical protein